MHACIVTQLYVYSAYECTRAYIRGYSIERLRAVDAELRLRLIYLPLSTQIGSKQSVSSSLPRSVERVHAHVKRLSSQRNERVR